MRRRHLIGPGAALVALALVIQLGPVAPWAHRAGAERPLDRAEPVRTPPPLAAPDSDVPVTAAAPTAVASTTTTSTTAPPPPPAQRFTLEPYRGLGAWVDVYDWSASFARGGALPVETVDELAAQGVQTIFIQASKWDAPDYVLDPELLMVWIDRAHSHGMDVVGWFLPTLEDPTLDLHRLLNIAALPVDGLAVDIEARNVPDPADRSARAVQLSSALRAALPGEVLGAIPMEPVLMEDVNPGFWPGFPWAELAPSYDVWLPMAYWTNRKHSSPWRDAYVYTVTNVDRIRTHIGQPDAPVHVLGGIGDQTSVEDLWGFRQAATDRGAIGGSIYDFRTTAAPHWPELLPFRDLRPG